MIEILRSKTGILDLAREYVIELETRELKELHQIASEAAQHAERCKCRICHNEAQSATDAFVTERYRLIPPPSKDGSITEDSQSLRSTQIRQPH